jgi:serine/threonine protein kinase
MKPCPTEEMLSSLLAEGLAQPKRLEMETHIEQCSSCQESLHRLTDGSVSRRAGRANVPVHNPPLELRQDQSQESPAAEPSSQAQANADKSAGVETLDTSQKPTGDRDAPSLDFLDPPTRPESMGRIGHYEVLQVLGHGGFGIVFRAFDEVLQRVVAVKVLAPEVAATSPARKRFLREARSSAAVRHENIVQVYAVEEQPLPYLVMEFIPGENLQQRLDRTGPLDAAEVVQIGRRIAEGLAAAHAMGMIHRDIKPANILIDGGLRVKITDFGLARAADDASLTQSGTVAGTPMYMSPEQASGESLDHRTDLFSLGSVLYAICSGHPPFRAGNTLAVLKRVTEDIPRPISEIIPETPWWLCDLIARLHAKQPARRLQTAQEVADLLAVYQSSPPARSARPLLPTGWWSRRSFAAAAVVLFAAALGGVWYHFASRGDHSAQNALRKPSGPAASDASVDEELAPPPGDFVFLDDLTEIEWANGHGVLGKHGGDFRGGSLNWRGKRPTHALFTHPGINTISSVTYDLDGKYDSLAGLVGIANMPKGGPVPLHNEGHVEEVPRPEGADSFRDGPPMPPGFGRGDTMQGPPRIPAPLTFRVLGDERELWKSKPIQEVVDEDKFEVSVRGVRQLRLEVHCPGLNMAAAATWLSPRLTRADATRTP